MKDDEIKTEIPASAEDNQAGEQGPASAAPPPAPPAPRTPREAAAYEVFCKIPAGMIFTLPDGRKVTLAGQPLSGLMDSKGRRLPESGYGKTIVPAADWEHIQKTYQGLPALRRENPVIFARPSGKGGAEQAREQAGVKSGFEQLATDGAGRDKSLKTRPTAKGK